MALSINTNVASLAATRNLTNSSATAASSIGKLSSGSRIVTAKDDAASLAIANGLKLDLAALRAADANIKQGTSILQIADGGYNQLNKVLERMKTLSATAQSDHISATEKGFLNTEYQVLLQEIDRIAASTEFNGVKLLGGAQSLAAINIGTDVEAADGFVGVEFDPNLRAVGDVVTIEFDETTSAFTLTVNNGTGTVASQTIRLSDIAGNPFDVTMAVPPGAGNGLPDGETYQLDFGAIGVKIRLSADFDVTAAVAANNTIEVDTGTTAVAANLSFLVGVDSADMVTISLQLGNSQALGVAGSAVDSTVNAQAASLAIEAAVGVLNTARAEVGTALSRMEFAGANVSVQIENSEAARSVLEDVDVAVEFTKFTSAQVLVQAGVSILAQANQQPSLLLRLLQG